MPSMPRPYKKLTKLAYDLIGMPVNYSDCYSNKRTKRTKSTSGDKERQDMFSKVIQNVRQGSTGTGY